MTARLIFHRCRKAGIALSVAADVIKFKAPRGAMTPALAAEIKRIKPELLALLDGFYLDAAKALILRETMPGDERMDLAQRFDERVAICTTAGQTFDLAYRTAYIELARAIEGAGVRREGVPA